MTNEIENIDSLINESDEAVTIDDNDDIETMRDKFSKVSEAFNKTSEANKKLYARTKKAEGFEQIDGKWVKPPKAPVETPSKPEVKSVEFDSGDKALLRSYDIKGADEIALARTWMTRTGDDIDVMAEDQIFQSKLKSLRDAKASADAIPKSNKRGTAPVQNDEAYWTAKIESGQATLNDIEDIAMRRKVLNKKVEVESRGNRFSANPIVMN